ncbi:MAG: hypothetical protein HeimC3_37210 [Candidatus Heimdallarchaeota archaeon LC_3]|nr:MAG: hypothetical protein HeimC3_37210 [Candidatus Heimdallarchaeota archaeon LC_3]
MKTYKKNQNSNQYKYKRNISAIPSVIIIIELETIFSKENGSLIKTPNESIIEIVVSIITINITTSKILTSFDSITKPKHVDVYKRVLTDLI